MGLSCVFREVVIGFLRRIWIQGPMLLLVFAPFNEKGPSVSMDEEGAVIEPQLYTVVSEFKCELSPNLSFSVNISQDSSRQVISNAIL